MDDTGPYKLEHVKPIPGVNSDSKVPQEEVEGTKLSKKQEKRAKKKALWLEQRPERRRQEKLKLKMKKQKLKEQLASKTTSNQSPVGQLADNRSAKSKFKSMSDSTNKTRIVIDCDFDKYMSEKDIFKLVKQILRIYSINRRANEPCQLFLTSLTGRVGDIMLKCHPGLSNWDIHWSDKHYSELFSPSRDHDDIYKAELSDFIYLSGDSDNVLSANQSSDQTDSHIDTSKVYIIGGLVDHNHYKGLCLDLANSRGIQTARLPIDFCQVKMTQRHILSVDNVFEILLNVSDSTLSWIDALKACIPKRKLCNSDEQQSSEVDPNEVKV